MKNCMAKPPTAHPSAREGPGPTLGSIAGRMAPPSRTQQLLRRIELTHDPVQRLVHACYPCAPSHSSRNSRRISKAGMTGSSRMNRNIKVLNKPRVPSRNDQSQKVGVKMPHADGRKSRAKLPTTIMKRSSHMPTLMAIETQNRINGVVRTRLNHSSWVTATLHSSTPQYTQAYGP